MRIRKSAPFEPAIRKRRGATALEYIFALSLIFAVCIAAVTYLGDKVKSSLTDSANKIPDVGGKK
jgi:Flp pilus assembly pilin Flp